MDQSDSDSYSELSDQANRLKIPSTLEIDEGASRAARWKRSLIREVASHPFGYSVLAVALVTGPILLRMIFPEITLVQAIVGGIAFGVYLALCAVPQKFM